MGSAATRTLLALWLASLSLAAQDDAYKARQLNYKRFTRGDDVKVQDEAWGRLEWFRERMGGDLGPDFAQRLLSEAERERTRYPAQFPNLLGPERAAAVSGTQWVSLGPTTAAFIQNGVTLNKVDSGRPRTILPDTADATGNTVYLLAAGGGLWKTTNFLSTPPTWTPMTDFVGSTMAGAAAFGRSTSTLYVGAGDPFDAGVGGFMIKSANGGSTWSTHAALGTASTILDIKVDTSQTQDIVLVGTNTGLFRSVDGGATYSAVASATGWVWSLAQTSAGWLASTVASDGTGSLLKSTDRGATWTTISSATYTGAGRTTLGVGAPGDAVVYAFAAAKGTGPETEAAQLDLFRSADGGQTWTALGMTTKAATNVGTNQDQTDLNLMHSQAWYNHMLLVDPTDSGRNTVYLGGDVSTAKTTDGGTTWALISNWLPSSGSGTGSLPYVHADCHCAAFSNLGGTARLYFGTDGGLFTSTNGGTSWDDSKNTGLVNHLHYSLISNPATTGSVLTGIQDNGTRIRVSTTSTFNQVRGGDGFGVGWSQANNAVSMSSYTYNAIRRSTTNPVTDQSQFSTFTSGLGSTGSTDGGTSYYFVTPLITPTAKADLTGQIFFTYGNNGTGTNSKKIFMSSSTAWTTIGTAGVGGWTAARFIRSVSHGIGVSPTDLLHIGAAGNGGYLLLTSDGGTTWNEIFLGATPPDGQNIGWTGYNANVAWASNSHLYVCSESSLAAAAHVAASINGGNTWNRADSGLPDVPVTKLAVDPGDATGNTVYAATWIGVYRTTNGGTSWSLFGTGLPQGRVTDIWVAPDSSVIRVATWGRGIWELAGTATSPSVTLSPATATLINGGTQAFTPTVTNGTTSTVTWTATTGTIAAGPTANGVAQTYTAPASGTTATVTATTVDTPVSTSSVTLTLVAPSAVTVAVSPATFEMVTGTGTKAFSATASPLTNNAVTWTGTGVNGSGTFNATGLAAGSYTVTATSAAAPTRSGSATVSLVAPGSVTVKVSPASAGTVVGGTAQFSALVTGVTTANQGVTWTLSGGGSISSTGLFTATALGTFTVTATNAFSSQVGTASITVRSLDLNGDGVTDLRDLLFFAKSYGTATASCDLNGDGLVNDTDLSLLLAGL